MRYVGLAALAIAYWVNVVLLHLVLTDPRLWRAHPSPPPARAADPTPIAPPAAAATCALPRAAPFLEFVDDRPRDQRHWLSKQALVAGMNRVRPAVGACYCRYLVPGVAMVNVVIDKSGRVAKAEVTGKFAGTPSGACVEAAVKTARFPPSDGFSTPYPFQLK